MNIYSFVKIIFSNNEFRFLEKFYNCRFIQLVSYVIFNVINIKKMFSVFFFKIIQKS